MHSGACLIDRGRKRKSNPDRANPEAANRLTINFRIIAAAISRPATRSPACAIASQTSNNVGQASCLSPYFLRVFKESTPHIDTHVINTPQGDKKGINGNGSGRETRATVLTISGFIRESVVPVVVDRLIATSSESTAVVPDRARS